MEKEHEGTNFSCEKCHKTFDAENDLETHREEHHRTMEVMEETSSIDDRMKEKDDMIEKLLKKNEVLTKVNVNLDKENKRINQAFNQSMFEKGELGKEIRALENSMNEVIKEKSNLEEDIKVKTNLIKLLRSSLDSREAHQVESLVYDGDSTQIGNENKTDDWIKCKECDYKTKVQKYMKSHKLAHTGQYQCQKGCKESLKTIQLLD